MHAYDPRDWTRWPEWGGEPPTPNLDALLGWGLTVAFCVFAGSFFPPDIAPSVIVGSQHWAAWGYACAAALLGHRVRAPHLTAWDQAAGCLLLATAGRLLAPDPAAAGAG